MGLLDKLYEWQVRAQDKAQALAGQLQAGRAQPTAALLARQLRSAGLFEDPAAQAAVGQMMQPQSRFAGMTAAAGMLAPGAAEERAFNEQQLVNQRVNQQAQGFNNMLQALQERRQAQLFPGQMDLQRAQLAASQEALMASRFAREQKLSNPGMLYELMTGSQVPAEFRAVFTPQGQPMLRPIEGSAAWKKSLGEVRAAEAAIYRAQTFSDDLAEYGTEQLPTEAKGRMASTRAALMADLGKMQELGVLQPADVERLSAMIPDPTSVSIVQSDAEAQASMKFIEEELERMLMRSYEANPWVERGQVSLPGQK